MKSYDIIIIGGGPVGAALGIELGMLNIKTAIIEKHTTPQMLPKAQLLNPRSMEFFRRWGINQALISKRLLPLDYPLRSTWCSGMAGKVYSSVNIAENISKNLSPESYQRIPLWLTEEVLRQRISEFPSVDYISYHEALHVEQNNNDVSLTIKNRKNNQSVLIKSQYIVGCDGSRSITRQFAGIKMKTELPPLRMINVLFRSKELKEKMTVDKGILYYNLTLEKPAGLGCVDYDNGLWYALITYPGTDSIDQVNVSTLLDGIAGFTFQKEIIQNSFWMREAMIAEKFREKRLFIAGDAAHTQPPNGGHGLNTGLGDAVNLAWKLAAVINKQGNDTLLDTYEIERRPIAMQTILAAKKNAQDAASIREKYPLDRFPDAFAKENERISRQHSISSGLSLGYCYTDSPIIFQVENHQYNDPSVYELKALPGFFTPHCIAENKSIYDFLSVCYTLLITHAYINDEIEPISKLFFKKGILFKILFLPNSEVQTLYSKKYYLLRPDWHIAWCGEDLPNDIDHFLNHLMPS